MGLNVVNAAVEFRIPKIVMVSTVCAYPCVPNTIPFIEEEIFDSLPEPTNSAYAHAKRTIMHTLWAVYQQYGLSSVTLNLANLYGPGDSQDLKNNHAIPAIISKLKTAKETRRSAVLWGDGTASRDFLFVKDACKAIVKALDFKQTLHHGINIGTGIETKIHEIADYVRKLLSLPPEMVLWDNSRPNGQQRRCLNITKAKELLGWTPSHNLYEEIKLMLEEGTN